eukprot:258223-Rhodomonas_salina.1
MLRNVFIPESRKIPVCALSLRLGFNARIVLLGNERGGAKERGEQQESKVENEGREGKLTRETEAEGGKRGSDGARWGRSWRSRWIECWRGWGST